MRIGTLLAGWTAAALGLALGGCRMEKHAQEPMARPQVKSFVAGRSLENRPIEVRLIGHGADVTLIIATIHGNEAAGTPLVARLEEHLTADGAILRNRRVVIVPVANPDGLARNMRTNARGVDLNRNFPTENRVAGMRSGIIGLSEPESTTLERLVQVYRPSKIVSIHQPVNCVDYDGPAEELARRMSSACGMPVKKIGALPGSLGSYAGVTMGIPIVTYELPRSADTLDPQALWERYGPALVEAIRYDTPTAK
jgi:protein MpaA